jgi:hypothetical protein
MQYDSHSGFNVRSEAFTRMVERFVVIRIGAGLEQMPGEPQVVAHVNASKQHGKGVRLSLVPQAHRVPRVGAGPALEQQLSNACDPIGTFVVLARKHGKATYTSGFHPRGPSSRVINSGV